MSTDPATIDVRFATADDAFAIAALHLKWDLESGASNRPGFVDEYADAWLAARVRRPTWLASRTDGDPVGVVGGALVTKLPSLRRPANAWMHLNSVYVVPDLRGQGLGRRMLDIVIGWCADNDVIRLQLNATDEARTLYGRTGFTPPSETLMELNVTPAR